MMHSERPLSPRGGLTQPNTAELPLVRNGTCDGSNIDKLNVVLMRTEGPDTASSDRSPVLDVLLALTVLELCIQRA